MKKTPMRAAADGCSGTPVAVRRPRGHPVTWMRRSSPWTMRRIRPTSMRSSLRGSAASTSRPRSRCTRTRSRASARTSTTSMTTSSTRFAWPPEDDVAKGRTTYSYQFKFDTTYRNRNTILQSYLGVIGNVGDASQNLIQRYTVDKVDWRTGRSTRLGRGIVPPNNQGNATPKYNRNNDGEQPAKDGVATEGDLDAVHVAVDRRARGRVPRLCRSA